MKKEIILRLSKSFEETAHIVQGIEYWMARDVQKLLDYDDWRNFLNVIEKAKIASQKIGHLVSDHFVDLTKMVNLGFFVKL